MYLVLSALTSSPISLVAELASIIKDPKTFRGPEKQGVSRPCLMIMHACYGYQRDGSVLMTITGHVLEKKITR